MRYNAARGAKVHHANRDLAREVDARGGRFGGRRANRARRLRDGAGGAGARRNHPNLNRRADADRHSHAANADRCAHTADADALRCIP